MRPDETKIALELGANCSSCDCGRKDGIFRGKAKQGQVFCTRHDKAVSSNGVCTEYTRVGVSLVRLYHRSIGERMRVEQTELL